MDNLMATIVFTVPGLMAYFWIRMFGINPTTQPSVPEVVGLSTILWIPTVSLFVAGYDVLFFMIDPLIDLNQYGIIPLLTSDDINTMASKLPFLLLFTALTTVLSYWVARLWGAHLYNATIRLVNKVRLKRNVSELSSTTSTWDKFFIDIGEGENNGKGSPLIVEVYKLGEEDKSVVGCMVNASRPFESERALIIDQPEAWKKSVEHFPFRTKQCYVDLKSGLVVNQLV